MTSALTHTNEQIVTLIEQDYPDAVDPELNGIIKFNGTEPYDKVDELLNFVNKHILVQSASIDIVDEFVRKNILAERGNILVDTSFDGGNGPSWRLYLPQYGNVKVYANRVRMSLETKDGSNELPHVLSDLRLLEPRSSSFSGWDTSLTLHSDVQVKAVFNITIEAEDANEDDGSWLLKEGASLEVILDNISIKAGIFAGISQMRFEDLGFGQLFPLNRSGILQHNDLENRLLCGLTAFDTIRVSDLDVSLNVMSANVYPMDDEDGGSKKIETQLDHLVNSISAVFLDQYQSVVHDTIHAGIQYTVRNEVNRVLEKALDALHSSALEDVCPAKVYPHEHDYVVWSALLPFQMAYERGTPKALSALLAGINTYITEKGWLSAKVYEEDYEKMDVHLTLEHLGVDGMGHMKRQSEIFAPVENDPYALNTELYSNNCPNSHSYDTSKKTCNPLSLDFTAEWTFSHPNGSKVVEVMRSTLHLADLSFTSSVRALLDKSTLANRTVGQVLHEKSCLFASFDKIGMNHTSMGVGTLNLDVWSKVLPGLFRRDTIANHVDEDERHIFVGRRDLTQMIDLLLHKGASVAQGMVNRWTEIEVNIAPHICPAEIAFTPALASQSKADDIPSINRVNVKSNEGTDSSDDDGLWWKISLIVISCAVVTGVATVAVRRSASRVIDEEPVSSMNNNVFMVDDQQMASEPSVKVSQEISDETSLVEPLLSNEVRTSSASCNYSASLFTHDRIPTFVRYAVPLALCCTACLFAISNGKVGATVDGRLGADKGDGQGTTTFDPNDAIYEFSLVSILHDMWSAGTYELLILIFTMSILVPYIKLLLMMFAWLTPQNILSVNTREKLLVFLEAIGKYALVDAFVLQIMIVAFRYHLELDIAGQQLVFDVYTNPRTGFYCFLTATIMSIVMGHTVLFYHRHSCARKVLPEGTVVEAYSLVDHEFVGNDSTSNRRIKLSKPAVRLILGGLILSTVLMFVGVILKSYEFTFYGLAGLVLDDPDRNYSVLVIGKEIPSSVEDEDGFGILFIQGCYYFFGVAMPFTCLILMYIIYRVPMHTKTQTLLFSLVELSSAWSALEVFLLSIIASLAEISDIASYIVGDICDDLDSFLEQSEFFDTILNGHDTCFDVKASAHSSSAVLFIGVFVNLFVTFFLVRIIHQAIEERIDREGVYKDGEEEENAITVYQHGMISTLDKYERLKWLFVETRIMEEDNIETRNGLQQTTNLQEIKDSISTQPTLDDY